eukprot:96584-Chlamydomonas_euryale.AAC.1
MVQHAKLLEGCRECTRSRPPASPQPAPCALSERTGRRAGAAAAELTWMTPNMASAPAARWRGRRCLGTCPSLFAWAATADCVERPREARSGAARRGQGRRRRLREGSGAAAGAVTARTRGELSGRRSATADAPCGGCSAQVGRREA